MSMLPSVFVLSALALVALVLTRDRPIAGNMAIRRDAAHSLALAIGAQGAHFAEEAATGLHEQLPALLGQSAMPFAVFLLFNVAWLAIWAASVPGLRSGRPAAFFADLPQIFAEPDERWVLFATPSRCGSAASISTSHLAYSERMAAYEESVVA